MKSKIVTFVTLAFAFVAHAQEERGNGGDAVVCYTASGDIRSVELLDLYEASWHLDFDMGPSRLGVEAKLEYVLTRMERLDPSRAALYRHQASTFFGLADIRNGIDLEPIHDSEHHALPAGCELEQLAVRRTPLFPHERLYTIDGDLWDLMTDDHKAGLILHEIVYSEALSMHQANSRRTRYFVGHLAARDLDAFTIDEYKNLLALVGFPFTDIQPPDDDTPALEVSGPWIDIPSDQSEIHSDPYIFGLNNGLHAVFWVTGSGDYAVGRCHYVLVDETGQRIGPAHQLCSDGLFRDNFRAARFSNGDFVLVYRKYRRRPLAGHGPNAERLPDGAQIFNSQGHRIGQEIPIYHTVDEQIEYADVAVLGDDSFVVTYENRTASTAHMRRFERSGSPVTQLYTFPEAYTIPTIAALRDGNFVVAQYRHTNASVQVFDPNFSVVSTHLVGHRLSEPAKVVTMVNGDFAVLGIRNEPNIYELKAFRFGADYALKSETVVSRSGGYPSITAVENGFYVNWVDNDYRAYGQHFGADDQPITEAQTLFDHDGSRCFIGDSNGSYYSGNLLIAFYDMDQYDVFLRRLSERP